MNNTQDMDIFLVVAPGLENALAEEARDGGFDVTEVIPGGVTVRGDWTEVWRANLTLRGATRVLARIGSFRVFHLAQLDKRSRKFPWADVLRPDLPFRVEATCRKSKIYHAKAATQRIERAIAETLGAPVSSEAEIVVKARIEDDLCTFSIDTSGESLHKRGHKPAVGKAPMRETLAALFLRDCGFDGSEPLVDPMCGSGTFVIEAAEIAAGLQPGRSRRFAFENLATFDSGAFGALKTKDQRSPPAMFYGFDRNDGAIASSRKNAEAAGVSNISTFAMQPISDLSPPDGPPGLVIVNPPYGARIGNKKLLYALYGTLGKTLTERFSGWRVGIVTSEPSLAKATQLPFLPPGPPVAHGGLRVKLWKTAPLR
ncbi:THUMP domain-containing class I SAM-dependent RNA methyltransferase [Shimia biformata]|uniref:THUMP domain-containing class I SAM-dependent RNA methyltransferase n=1 Tax=Shimia biformata TaxID=1294299 RepID=UPI0019513ECB|nr:class I SAM-dependent RNA methyltransferase [Shimia biformata]